MSISNLTPSQLRQAADLQEQIEKLQKQLTGLVAGDSAPAPVAAKSGRSKMSASARAKIAAAQRARWAALKGKGAGKKAAAKPAKKGRRKMSAEGRARIAAAAKARWAKVRAAKASKS